jgi:MRG-binding protein
MSAKPQKTAFIDTVEGEISFYRSVMRARPVGIHSHFHVLTIRNAIFKDTGHAVTAEEIWDKLKGLYDLEALEGLVRRHDFLPVFKSGMTGRRSQENDGYDSAGSNGSTPSAVRSPSPSENLSGHPFFRQEFSLPFDEICESLISARRVCISLSPPATPHVPSPTRKPRSSRTRRKLNTSDMAGLVAGDSDSSALTQESGDEGAVPNARASVVTGTEGETDEEGDEDETREESAASKLPRNKPGKFQKRTAAATTARTFKKRKR